MVLFFINLFLLIEIEKYLIPEIMVIEHFLRFFILIFSVVTIVDIFIIHYCSNSESFEFEIFIKTVDLSSFLISAIILGIALSKVNEAVPVNLWQSILMSVYPANAAVKIRKLAINIKENKTSKEKSINILKPHRKWH